MDINKTIRDRLDEIENKEHVRILHCVESGSRAWGFASPDSDYDVRFVYARKPDHYLSLRPKKDYIDWELNETLDINGWDISKALQLFYKSNATVFEWSNSPVIYKTTETWDNVRKVSENYFSVKSAMYHYYGTASSNYHKYLTEEYVKYKKYFYVLRPLLCCKWIEENRTAPPVIFDDLAKTVLSDKLKPVVDKLVAQKIKMSESDKDRRVDVLNTYIVEELERYKILLDEMHEEKNRDWDALDEIFKKIILS
ncbi:MAG: nucleotidyltransferase domain-containing protein [Firmicutes bacterium]|nr:nucleotidyltransferase domain-containing protein [Bacillota bacterium]